MGMMDNRLTAEERRLRDEAIEAGRVTLCPPQVRRQRKEKLKPLDMDAVGVSKQPPEKRSLGKVTVRDAIEWAFSVERAQIQKDEIGDVAGFHYFGRGAEAVIAERYALGKVRIDNSPGRSEPAEAAQIVASYVRLALPWEDATWVAGLARAQSTPDFMADVTPRLAPASWVHGQSGPRGRQGDSSKLGTRPTSNPLDPVGWAPIKRVSRKRGYVTTPVPFTPCIWTPSAQVVGNARRLYLRWWNCLLEVRNLMILRPIDGVILSRNMPPLKPWAEGEIQRSQGD